MSKQAMKLALEALEWAEFLAENCEATCQDAKHSVDAAITAIKLALTEHEEFTRLKEFCLQLPEVREALAEQPEQRTWVGLTDEESTKCIEQLPRGIKGWMSDWDLYDFTRAIEAKLKEKNT